MPQHPKGTRARVRLSSVFKPFAHDVEFGSRAINPAELYLVGVVMLLRMRDASGGAARYAQAA